MANKDDFVYAPSDLTSEEGVFIGINDVGICKSAENQTCTIFFITAWKDVTIPCSAVTVFNEKETGDAFPKKICNVCHKLKDTAEFDRNQNGVNNRPIRRPSCRSCRVIMEGTNVSGADRTKWKKIKPEREPFECPICQKRTIAGVTSKVVLEHDHETGEVRGWVCDSCNTGLGRFKDDPELLKRAIKFLEEN